MAGNPLSWAVAYYEGMLPPRMRDSSDHLWSELPRAGVLWVTVRANGYAHSLGGMDYYWVDGSRFGMFNDPANEGKYEGWQEVAWEVASDGFRRIEPPGWVDSCLVGMQVSDLVWEELRRYQRMQVT